MAELDDEWRDDPSITSRPSLRSVSRLTSSPSFRSQPRRVASDAVSLSTLDEDDFRYFGIPSTGSEWQGERTSARTTGYGQHEILSGDDDGDLGMSGGIGNGRKVPDASERALHDSDSHGNSGVTSGQVSPPTPFDGIVTEYPSPAQKNNMFAPFHRFKSRRPEDDEVLLNPDTPRSSQWLNMPAPPAYRAAVLSRRNWKWWVQPSMVMYFLFVFGVLGAVGHHLYYDSLNGKPADDQLLRLRYGVVLAFIAKAGLVTAVVVAFKQRIWYTMRNRVLSVEALDSLFAATEDFTALFNVEVYKQAKVAMLLAVFVWVTPFLLIITSTTLTVELATRVENTTCPGIKTLNLTNEEVEDWRDPTFLNAVQEVALSLWNTTIPLNETNPNFDKPEWFDYYTAPKESYVSLATLAAYDQRTLMKNGANLDICGAGWNCSYTINFTAPAYKCTNVANGVGSEVKNLGDQKPPERFTTDLLMPTGTFSYYVYAFGSEYSGAQMKNTTPGGEPTSPPPYPRDMGAWRTEPVIWFGYSTYEGKEWPPPDDNTTAGWNEAFIPHVIACENWETDYTVKFDIKGADLTTEVTNRTFIHKVIDTTWDQAKDAMDGTNDNITASPSSNYVYPHDVRAYRRVSAFHSLGWPLRYFINGTIDSRKVSLPTEWTQALQTKLIDTTRYFLPYPNATERLESLFDDMILSILSKPEFLAVVWAADPSAKSGLGKGDESTLYPCVRSQSQNVFNYHVRDLWVVYALVILLAFAGIEIGRRAVRANEGVLRDTRFSTIVAATRGPGLDGVGRTGG
ncbi:hypothetical protein F5Y18DRAFT_131669 [Xylariaceae sp. FL1019]|nr:hypothetical protein F5Y18DRAFT_131669 [Xylariaceae sp. FL1019]